jgi:hypothetical protein
VLEAVTVADIARERLPMIVLSLTNEAEAWSPH